MDVFAQYEWDAAASAVWFGFSLVDVVTHQQDDLVRRVHIGHSKQL